MRAWQILRAIVPACFGSDRGAKLKAAFLQLAGAFPKLGQQLSLRRDWFPADVCDALSSLQSEHGAGTIGYVRLVGSLAVKRIHPGRREEIARDLRLLARVGLICRCVPVLRRLRLSELEREARQIFAAALDLRYEGVAADALRPELSKFSIHVPRVVSATQDELITERVFGWTLTELMERPWLVSRHRLRRHAERSVFALLYLIHERNLFPYDLHLGNLMVDEQGRLWWIDLATATTDDGFLRAFTRFMRCLSERDWSWAASNFIRLQRGIVGQTLLSKVLGYRKVSRVSRRLVRVLGQWAQDAAVPALSFHQRSLNTLVQRLVAVTSIAGGSLNWAWMPIQQAWMTLEAFVEVAWPRVNYLRVSERYVEDAKRRNPKAWKDRLGDLFDMADQQLDFLTDAGLVSAAFQGR